MRHLASIQNLGGMDALCSDKTVTLTRSEMTLAAAVDAGGAASARAAALAALNARFQSGIRSPLDAALLRDTLARDDDGPEKLHEIPFYFERRCVSIIVGSPTPIASGG